MQRAAGAHVLQNASEEDSVDIRSAGGQGGAFLLSPRDESHRMPDAHFIAAFRRRLRVANPALLEAVEGLGPVVEVGPAGVAAPVAHDAQRQGAQAAHADRRCCCHRHAADKRVCGEDLDDRSHQAGVCGVGGGVVQRHDHVRDWLAGWIASRSGQTVTTEQFVPAWDRMGSDGSFVRARCGF